jgi:hypothetical protein
MVWWCDGVMALWAGRDGFMWTGEAEAFRLKMPGSAEQGVGSELSPDHNRAAAGMRKGGKLPGRQVTPCVIRRIAAAASRIPAVASILVRHILPGRRN